MADSSFRWKGGLGSAIRLLHGGSETGRLELKESWWEKLGRWEEALGAYNNKIMRFEMARKSRNKYNNNNNNNNNNNSIRSKNSHDMFLPERWLSSISGRLRCLDALGEWTQVGREAGAIFKEIDKSLGFVDEEEDEGEEGGGEQKHQKGFHTPKRLGEEREDNNHKGIRGGGRNNFSDDEDDDVLDGSDWYQQKTVSRAVVSSASRVSGMEPDQVGVKKRL